MELKESDLVLCIVEKIEKTAIFVKIENNGSGTITTSEIAPGRIRNIRDYVVPGKRIVCKVLEIDKSGNIRLSLRRVSGKERQEVLDIYEKEKNCLSIIRSIAKEKAEEIAERIKKESSLYEFFQNCRENPKQLEKYFTKEEAEKICKILQEKKDKNVEVKKEFSLKSNLPDGMTKIKKILMPYKNSISYLAAGRFIIKIISSDYKKANFEVQKILEDIENNARKDKLDFTVGK
jgi:translation initiation factor 2 alpha subunit (eIF-2alpha)